MRIRTVALVAICIVWAGASVNAQVKAVVILPTANVFTSPSMNGKVLFAVKKGAHISVASTDSVKGWYEVSLWNGKHVGWIHGNGIRLESRTDNSFKGYYKDYSTVYASQWIRYASTSTKFFLYDPSRMMRIGSVMSVWVKEIDSTTSLLLSMALLQTDCSKHLNRTATWTNYASNGSVISSGTRPDAMWEPVVPESTGEALEQTVCKL